MKIKKVTRITYIWQRVLMAVVFIVGLLGVILNDDQSVKSEYLFVCAQSAMFLIVSFLPNFLRKFELDIPDFIYIIFICFCLAHFFCGEILGFFVKIKWWDSVLHTFSGMIIALLSFSLINLLNKNSSGFKLNIGFAALFAFSLAVTIGVLWEFFEYGADKYFRYDMQKDIVINSISTVTLDNQKDNNAIKVNGIDHTTLYDADGNELAVIENGYLDIGIIDTMKDLFVNFIGAVAFSFIGYVYIKDREKYKFANHFIPKKSN